MANYKARVLVFCCEQCAREIREAKEHFFLLSTSTCKFLKISVNEAYDWIHRRVFSLVVVSSVCRVCKRITLK